MGSDVEIVLCLIEIVLRQGYGIHVDANGYLQDQVSINHFFLLEKHLCHFFVAFLGPAIHPDDCGAVDNRLVVPDASPQIGSCGSEV